MKLLSSLPHQQMLPPVLPAQLACFTAGGPGRVCRDHQRRRRLLREPTYNRLGPPGGRHPLPHHQQRADVQRHRGGQSEAGHLGGYALQDQHRMLSRQLFVYADFKGGCVFFEV